MAARALRRGLRGCGVGPVLAPREGRPALRALIAAFGDAGHAFPAIALGREMAARGHEVVIESWERWREPVEELGLEFAAAEEYVVFPPPPPGSSPGAGEAAVAMLPLLDRFGPDVVVSDILTLAPSLAADLRGVPRATLVPHLYPVHDPGMPFFGIGMAPPRTALGRWGWRAALPALEAGLRRGRRELNETRGKIGLAAAGAVSRRHQRAARDRRARSRSWSIRATGPMRSSSPGRWSSSCRTPTSSCRRARSRSSSSPRARPRIPSAS